MKLIMWLIIGYLGYKFWLKPKLLKSGNQENNFKEKDNSNRRASNYDDDYVDYEEIDD